MLSESQRVSKAGVAIAKEGHSRKAAESGEWHLIDCNQLNSWSMSVQNAACSGMKQHLEKDRKNGEPGVLSGGGVRCYVITVLLDGKQRGARGNHDLVLEVGHQDRLATSMGIVGLSED
jgi:hypothetical protein